MRRVVVEHLQVMLPAHEADLADAGQRLLEHARQSQKLLDAHYADAITLIDMKREQDRLALVRAEAEATISRASTSRRVLQRNLDNCI